jgi:hypothetical protein
VSPWIVNASPLVLLGKIDRLAWVELLCPAFIIPRLQPEIDRLLSAGSLLAPAVIQKALGLAEELDEGLKAEG